MERLYDNHEGWSAEGLRIAQRVREFAAQLFLDHPEYSSLELSGLVVSALEEARCEVGLRRRLSDGSDRAS